jgi:predicted acyltransferase
MRDIHLDKKVFDQISAKTGEKDPAKIFLSTSKWTAGKFDRGYNLANQIDFKYLPGFKGYDYYDPDGLFSTIPVIATCLLGVFAGLLLRSGFDGETKVRYLMMGGTLLIICGVVWAMHFPIVKRLWSPSFVLVTGGISAILLAAMFYVVDLAKYDRWCAPFIWIGMNSITIYFSKCIINYSGIANRFVGGEVKRTLNGTLAGAGDTVVAIVGLTIAVLICRELWKRKIFLRV